MPYNFAANSFHTKKLCSRLSSSEVRFKRKNGRFAFSRPHLGDLGATYDDHLRLIGKRVMGRSISVNWTLRAIVYSKSAISLQRGPVYPKFRVEGSSPTNQSSSQYTRLNYLNWERWAARPYSSSDAGSGVVLRHRATAAYGACLTVHAAAAAALHAGGRSPY